MSEPKTKPTEVSAESHIAAIAKEEQRNDTRTLLGLMPGVTKQDQECGPCIVGFGSYHYKYASGHEGDSALAVFAVRGSERISSTSGRSHGGWENLSADLCELFFCVRPKSSEASAQRTLKWMTSPI